ncbi:MAG: hypothetical protein Q9190_003148 [Brigantiaea leucoxantha]
MHQLSTTTHHHHHFKPDGNHHDPACRTLSTAQKLATGFPRATAVALDVSSTTELDPQIASHNLVISLVPYVHHASIIKLAIKHRVNVVTTSYVSDAIRMLDAPAKEAGIVILNEVGVDPGVDHLYAIKKIGEGKKVEISNKDLMGTAKPYFVLDGYNFVAYPNRNSLPFQEVYNIPEAETVLRGSLRYEGNPALVKALIDLGWLDTQPKEWLKTGITWAEVLQKAIGAEEPSENALVSRVEKICQFSDEAERERILSGLRWIGLFSSEPAIVRGENLLDTLCAQLEKELSYQPGERDLVVLQHKFVVEWQDGKKETFTSTLELYGEPQGYSGMAKSVGVTCDVATQLLLDGYEALSAPGVLAPYKKEICDPIRELVEREGIKLVETLV